MAFVWNQAKTKKHQNNYHSNDNNNDKYYQTRFLFVVYQINIKPRSATGATKAAALKPLWYMTIKIIIFHQVYLSGISRLW